MKRKIRLMGHSHMNGARLINGVSADLADFIKRSVK